MKTYKVISGPKEIVVEKGKEHQAFTEFGSIINAQATDGWEYHSMETIAVTSTQTGCGTKTAIGTVNHYMLIFVKDE